MVDGHLPCQMTVTFQSDCYLKQWGFAGRVLATAGFLLAFWLLTACGAPQAPASAGSDTPSAIPPPTEVAAAPPPPPTDTPAPIATDTPTVEPPTATPGDWANTASVEGDYYLLGNPAAPIRLVDYSDFL